jgi:hypothetical protein
MKRIILIILVCFHVQGCSLFNSDYSPWVEDSFFFNKQGEERVYELTPRRLSRPELYIVDNECIIPEGLFTTTSNGMPKYQFKWDVQVQVVRNGEILETVKLKPHAAGMGGYKEGHDCYSDISFNVLKSITDLLFPKEVEIYVKVLKEDAYYANNDKGLLFGIRNSPIL